MSSKSKDASNDAKPNVFMLLIGDILSAMGASFALSPFVTAIDKAIVQYASGAMSLHKSVFSSFSEAVSNPLRFIRRPEFLMVWGVYMATYTAANTISTICEANYVNDQVPKFVGVSLVNIASCTAKDSALARMFGTGPPRPVPLFTYGCFTVRDCMTVAASFNLPVVMSGVLQGAGGMPQASADSAAQFACPIVVQWVSTPIHLLGLGIYNTPGLPVAERIGQIQAQYPSAVTARMARIAPAFGFGGIGNKYLRDTFRGKVQATNKRKGNDKVPGMLAEKD